MNEHHDSELAATMAAARAARLDFTAAVADLHGASMRALAAIGRFQDTEHFPEDLADDIISLIWGAAASIDEAALRAYTRLKS